MVIQLLEIAIGFCLVLVIGAYAAIAALLTVMRWRMTHVVPVPPTRK